MEELESIKKEIATLRDRNIQVAAEKAWERSNFRALSIVVITYVLAGLVLTVIGASHPWRNALIPTIGYALSTQSLPFLKKKWMERYIQAHPGKQS